MHAGFQGQSKLSYSCIVKGYLTYFLKRIQLVKNNYILIHTEIRENSWPAGVYKRLTE